MDAQPWTADRRPLLQRARDARVQVPLWFFFALLAVTAMQTAAIILVR